MASSEDGQQPALQRVALLCRNIAFSKLCSGVTYGATSYIYKPVTIGAMELSSPQCLLLALLNSLVTGDVTSCFLISDVCHLVQQLRSKHLKVWLTEDFMFPKKDIENAMTLLGELVANGALKLPYHVMGIMSSLGIKYGVTSAKLTSSSEEPCDLAVEMENAVSNNCPGDIITLVTEGGDVNGLTQSGDSLLHLAARTGNCASIAVLGFLRADMEVVNSSIATPLEVAVRNNSVRSVKALLMAGARLDRRIFRGDTYVHIAAAGGQNEALLALLEAGLEANRKNHLGETPLVQAVRNGNVRGVEILLERGADASIVPEGASNLIKKAVESRNVDLFRAFIKRRALPDLKSEDGETIVHFIARSGNAGMLKVLYDRRITANIKNKDGSTPLHVASDASIARMLLGMGAEIDAQDSRGRTALCIALKNSKADIVTFLLHSGANPHIKDKNCRTALHYAVEGSCIESVDMLLESGVAVDEKDNKGETPALIAAINMPLVVLQLVERGADLNQRDSNGDGILHRAARSGHADLVSLLLDAGTAVDMRGKGDRTALHWASEVGHANVVSVLLYRGADPGAKASYCTPLIFAAYNGCLDVAKLLIDQGVSLNEKSTVGRTAFGYASDKGHKDVADLLKAKGAI